MDEFKEVISIMRSFGVLDRTANLLVLGTSKLCIELYYFLKTREYGVDDLPGHFRYDFIFIGSDKSSDKSINSMLDILRAGGVLLYEMDNLSYFSEMVNIRPEYKILKVNKRIGLAKGIDNGQLTK